MINTVIIEDDDNDLKELVKSLSQYPQIKIVSTCNSGEKGLAAMTKFDPDLLFLDIEMPGMSGMEFLENLGANIFNKCRVVIYTAFAHYAVESFRRHAFDYLTKPIDNQELDEIIRRVESSLDNPIGGEEGSIARAEKELILLFEGNELMVLRLRDIAYFQYDGKERVWTAYFANHSDDKAIDCCNLKHTVLASDILRLSTQFVQVHRKYIVNIFYIKSVRNGVCSFYPPFENIEGINVSYKYRRRLLEQFANI